MAQGGRDEKLLEIKVGAMILAALVILVIFVLIIADVDFGKKQMLAVYFQNPGGLSVGVPVKVAGRKVGKVSEMTFVGQSGPKNPVTGARALVRVRIELAEEVFRSLYTDAHFYITTKGVLGDPFMEIDPGQSGKPISLGGKLFGMDPPRLDLFLADAAELVRTLNRLLVVNQDDLHRLIKSSSNVMKTVDQFVSRDEEGRKTGDRIERIMENVEQLTTDTQLLVTGAREKYVDNPDIDKLLTNLRQVTGKLNRELPALIDDVRTALATLDRLGETLGPKEQEAVRKALGRLDEMSKRADGMVSRVDGIISRVERGQGTVGQLLKDEQIYDDLKELLRDLKHHPWKLIWEE